jgi:hypothetical protein
MVEYDHGKRQMIKGGDRFSTSLVPVLRESVTSMLESFDVDVFLIAHFQVSKNRRQEIERALPTSVSLQVWEDATPLGYRSEHKQPTVLENMMNALSRQHRFVIKDNLLAYDLFLNFEDDMIVHGAHVQQFLNVTYELERLYEQASNHSQHRRAVDEEADFYGPLTKRRVSILVPGWMRVEAALPGWQPHDLNSNEHVPLNPHWNENNSALVKLDPTVCCHVRNDTAAANTHIPRSPPITDLFLWETSLDALSLRQLPHSSLGWVVLQAGNYMNKKVGSYWSGRDGYFADQPPSLTKGRYANNQGGWMATRWQIFNWHNEHCKGGLLPPFEYPFRSDGLDRRTVEFWSGGIHLFGIGGCNLQRVIPMDPNQFGKHLLYHSSNNKQRSPNVQHRFASRSIQHFWEQLNTIKQNAEVTKRVEIKYGKGIKYG